MRFEHVEALNRKNKSACCHSERRKISGYDSCGAKQKSEIFAPAQDDRCWNGLTAYPSTRLIQRSPEIPGRDGAIRPPFLAVLHQLFRRGKFPFAKSFREAFLHSVIADWPDIRPAKVKQQKHLHSPPTDTAHLCKTGDDFVIAHSEKRASGWHGAVESSSPRDLLLPRFWRAKDQRREVSHPVWQELLRGRAILFLDKARGPGPRLLRRLSRLVAGKRSIPPAHRTGGSR